MYLIRRLMCPGPRLLSLLLLVPLAVGCGGGSKSAPPRGGASGSASAVRLYTSYEQPVVDALLAAYHAAHAKAPVTVFRAPSGQLSARIATEQRSGGIRGDVLLLSDPLSMQRYAAQHLLRRWTPAHASAVPAAARTDTFWGVATSDVVVVSRPGSAPKSWQDLAGPRYRRGVALPDPNFAGSALGALGYFASAKGFGLDYYRRLKHNGAVQVQAPGDVIAGVAEGRFRAGMTLDFLARAARAKGSPVEISTPAPGAIQLYAPVAVLTASRSPAQAESFADFLLTRPAQQALAQLGRHPIRSDVPPKTRVRAEVVPNWPGIFRREAELRAGYRSIFGG